MGLTSMWVLILDGPAIVTSELELEVDAVIVSDRFKRSIELCTMDECRSTMLALL